MLSSIVAALASLLASVALLAIFVTGIVALLIWATRLQARVYARGISTYLQGIRRRHFIDRGLNPRVGRLRHQVRGEADGILLGGAVPEQQIQPRWAIPLSVRLEAATASADLLRELTEAERTELVRGLRQLGKPLETRWAAVLLGISIVFAVAVAAAWPLNSLEILSTVFSGNPFWIPIPGSQGWSLLHGDGSLTVHQVSGVLITGLIGGAITARLVGRLSRPSTDDQQAAWSDAAQKIAADVSAGQQSDRTLGKDRQTVRVLNLSAGGFDTMMQLGVAHALLVIQGRAPDAIVGVSAGAVHAAAIAAVLQAGEETYMNRNEVKADETPHSPTGEKGVQSGHGTLDAARRERRTLARVARLRRYHRLCPG